MKRILLSLGLSFFMMAGLNNLSAQDQTAGPALETGAKIEFAKEVHDYGTIDQYADGTCEFIFKNTGNEPLVISNARGSCGCTVPEWPKEPIAPGASSVIKVKYDTKRVGVIGKTVTIQSNAVNEPTKTIRIKGNVIAKPAGEAPVNKSGAPTVN